MNWRTCKHSWGPVVTLREPDFNVAYASVQVCVHCKAQIAENWCETRASGGTPGIFPPGTIELDDPKPQPRKRTK